MQQNSAAGNSSWELMCA